MTATDELRRLLDERGVECERGLPTETIVKEPFDALYVERPDGRMHVYFRSYLTPAQAVDATLGRGTCRDVGRYAFVCSVCGWASDEPHHVLGGFWPKYCPECGKAVIE